MQTVRRTSSEYSSSSISSGSKPAFTGDLDRKEQLKARGALYGKLMRFPMAVIAMIPSLLYGAVPIVIFLIFGKILTEHTWYVRSGGTYDPLPKIEEWCYYVLIIAALACICSFLNSFLWIRVGSSFTIHLKNAMFTNIMRSEVGFFDVTPVGDILTLLGEDAQLVQDAFGTTKGTQFKCFGQFISGIVACYVYSWKLALIATCLFPYIIIIIMVISKCIDRHINLKFYHVAESMTIAEETLASIRTVRGFNREDAEKKRFGDKTVQVRREDTIVGSIITCMMTCIMIGLWTVILGNLYYGGSLAEKGEIETGSVFSVFAFMMFGCMGLIELQTSLQGEQKAIASGARILQMIAHVPDIPFSGGETIDDFKGHIEFKNVSFKYPTRDVYVLKNVSFVIKPGQMGALVGHSGSGKSTCVQLLERFYDVTDGQILLDGKDIRTLDPQWLHTQIGLVSQEPILFHLSIRENIKYARPNATDEEMEHAAEMANAKKFIDKFPERYERIVGEKGSSMSGGQRQRIAIARAIIQNPVILITDEATSALDAGSEKKVQQALDKVMKNCTSVVVAHRLTTVRNADITYVFDAGEIKEIGTHDELVAKRGYYYDLVRRQLTEEDKQVKAAPAASSTTSTDSESDSSAAEERQGSPVVKVDSSSSSSESDAEKPEKDLESFSEEED